MRRWTRFPIGLPVLLVAACAAPESRRGAGDLTSRGDGERWTVRAGPELPLPVANNAVAAALLDGQPRIFSFLGLGAARDYAAITRRAFMLDVATGRWEPLPDVPGPVGRLAATAQAVGRRVFLFGGYSVAADGTETTSPATDIYLIDEHRYTRGADAPVPLDDTISGVWRDRLIFFVSGWSTDRTVTTVQAYDPVADRWQAATPIPGTPVFGHAGGVIDDTIVYCGGAKMLGAGTPKYGASAECYRGDIDTADPTAITWRAIAAHPGAPRYRAAAGPVRSGLHAGILFAGGTTNPYNYNGVGYDGRPAEPEASSWLYDIASGAWVAGPTLDAPTMDHRALVSVRDGWWIVGGFGKSQTVSRHVTQLWAGPPRKD